ncbi:MAG: acyl-CoA dehydrogenase domain protein [Actinomycetia bacterium]|nr:acyl-CoA dehydrogenase domain protein [Actinomycetes bacterium]
MLLDLTPDQEFFRETTAKFLADQVPAELLQRMAGTVPADWEASYWRRGAELGWTSLLVSEDAGGGSISEHGLVDLSVIAHEFGRRAAPGPLLPANVVAAALSDAGTHPEVLAELLAGTAIAAWCHSEPRSSSAGSGAPAARGAPGDVTLDIRADATDLILNGVRRPVEAGLQARYLLVTGRATQVLVPSDTPGITITPLRAADYSKHFAAVTFTDVRVPASAVVGEVGGAAGQVERQLQLALVIAAAETVGAMQAGFDMTLAWAFDRYSFGRPLASYQALKHRFADLKTWLEASHAITDAAAAAVAKQAADAGELASAAKAYVGQYGPELMQDCVQMHGGIGLTREHDLHLYLRRVTTDAMLYGTPADHRQRIADYVEMREGLS